MSWGDTKIRTIAGSLEGAALPSWDDEDEMPAPLPMIGTGGNGKWVWVPDDDRPDPPHDDSKDHDPCPECNPQGKGKTPGWYQPLTGPAEHCKWCEGAGWL